MRVISKQILAASALVLSGSASAMPIMGSIGFHGAGFTFNSSDFGSATSIAITSAKVLSSSGDFLSEGVNVNDTANFYSSLSLDSSVFGQPDWSVDLWNVGGFSFELMSMKKDIHNNFALVLSGEGVISSSGYDDTSGTWNFFANSFGNNFQWMDGTHAVYEEPSASIPEPSITLLLGAGLLGIGFTRKMRKAA